MQDAFNDDEELQARIAWYYYHDNITQGDIGKMFNLPRVKVSRLLEKARDSGMVEVRIHSPHQSCLALEKQLKERWNLQDVRVIPHQEQNDLTPRQNDSVEFALSYHNQSGHF